ncbi:uncharacterized protein PFLUO_LOCUS7149 [Penicillium psychrofluorescens]|uniref:uncharacterized protein n=1 Tax=Penicillium psychrofluorescens TaxID=3158075 RepID=UPI003CCD3D9E
MTSEIYESDDVWKRSPPLVAIKPNYGVEEKRPPFVPPGSPNATENDAAKGTPGRSRKHLPESRAQTRYGDSVLISFLEPSRPDIAYYEREHPLGQDWPPAPRDFNPVDHRKAKPELETTAKAAVDQLRDDKDSLLAGSKTLPPPNPVSVTLPPPAPSVKTEFTSPSRPRLPSISAAISAPSTRRPSEDLLALSPPYTDSSVRHSPEDRVSLPALQSLHSPPQSNPATSPDGNNRVLPSIHTLGVNPPDFPPRVNGIPPYPYPGPSSAGPRNDPAQERFPQPQHIPPSPFSHFSPTSTNDISNNPSPASMPTFWRTYSQTELHPSGASPYDPSPIAAKSPAAGYPTPTEQLGAGPGDRTSFDSTLSPNGNAPPGNYKCHHLGCTAPPFQTQYLLNSHANVHSQDRPHFCPVENCPRAIGGKGFKRKNEMMRHGLVHNSPGYVCPFCLDQQHKYPRPDNLQRYAIPLPRVVHFMLIFYQDTFESITSTRAKTIPSYEMYSRRGHPAVQEADGDG